MRIPKTFWESAQIASVNYQPNAKAENYVFNFFFCVEKSLKSSPCMVILYLSKFVIFLKME